MKWAKCHYDPLKGFTYSPVQFACGLTIASSTACTDMAPVVRTALDWFFGNSQLVVT
jgi:hypothetical protein